MHGTIEKNTTVQEFDWFPDWSGDVCAIIASGDSVRPVAVNQLKNRCRVIVVNNNHELAPWADVLYAADYKWWVRYPQWKEFKGLKISRDEQTCLREKIRRVYLLNEKDPAESRISIARKGYIARGGNSGFQAINLAVQFGARRLLWLGFDFCGKHWHGDHPNGMVNPKPQTLVRWAETLDKQAQLLTELGVTVINCSARSVLTAYPKMTIEAALKHFGITNAAD